MSTPGELSASLTFRRGAMARVGLDRVALLEAIADLGSISNAAKRLSLSYKGAWDAVQALNNLFDAPLVIAAPGGSAGGAAALTPRGRAVVAAFRQVEREIAHALARLEDGLAQAPDDDLRGLFWSLGMRTSARNALRGVIAEISSGGVSAEAAIDIGGGVLIAAVVTRRSAEDLGLRPGKPVIALIKSSFVVLAKGAGLRTSARNQLSGVVAAREDDGLDSEITLDLAGGKTLTASVTAQSARSLDLKLGDAVTALIKAPHVILAVE